MRPTNESAICCLQFASIIPDLKSACKEKTKKPGIVTWFSPLHSDIRPACGEKKPRGSRVIPFKPAPLGQVGCLRQALLLPTSSPRAGRPANHQARWASRKRIVGLNTNHHAPRRATYLISFDRLSLCAQGGIYSSSSSSSAKADSITRL